MSEYENSFVEEDERTYGKGILGALLGALLGAVVWAVVFRLGYVLGFVGLVIGFLASKGYDLLKGKPGKLKVVVLVISVILGVLAGTAGGLCWDVMGTMQEQGVPTEYFGEYMQLLLGDQTLVQAVISDAVQGLVFAIGGSIGYIILESKKQA